MTTSRRRRRLSPLLAAALALLAVGAAAAGAQPSYQHAGVLNFDFAVGDVKAEEVSWPVSLLVMRVKMGKELPGGLQRVVLLFRAANLSGRDAKAAVEATLLDAEGGAIATGTTVEGVEDGETEGYEIKLDVPAVDIPKIDRCRVKLSIKS